MIGAPFLSIVIVNWNGAEQLGRCLVALREDLAAGRHTDVEVVVVDNGSRDDSLSVVRRILPDARSVELSRNHGFAGGANQGFAGATGEWVATLNNDVRVEIGWVAAMRDPPALHAAHRSAVTDRLHGSRLGAGRLGRGSRPGRAVLRLERRGRGVLSLGGRRVVSAPHARRSGAGRECLRPGLLSVLRGR